jgi:hypothetical protein
MLDGRHHETMSRCYWKSVNLLLVLYLPKPADELRLSVTFCIDCHRLLDYFVTGVNAREPSTCVSRRRSRRQTQNGLFQSRWLGTGVNHRRRWRVVSLCQFFFHSQVFAPTTHHFRRRPSTEVDIWRHFLHALFATVDCNRQPSPAVTAYKIRECLGVSGNLQYMQYLAEFHASLETRCQLSYSPRCWKLES